MATARRNEPHIYDDNVNDTCYFLGCIVFANDVVSDDVISWQICIHQIDGSGVDYLTAHFLTSYKSLFNLVREERRGGKHKQNPKSSLRALAEVLS